MSWKIKQALKKFLDHEEGYEVFPAGQKTPFALLYPNSYHVGMSNLGMHILYHLINARTDTACERFFLPDRNLAVEYQKTRTPLLSLESQRPLYQFPLIGISLSFEMDVFHILEMLDLGKVKLLAKDRGNLDPIVITGGPCATFNPEPLADFIDVFVIGEGEETVLQILDQYHASAEANLDRDGLLQKLSQLPGVYVPRFYQHIYGTLHTLTAILPQKEVPARVTRQWIRNLDKYEAKTVIFTDQTEFKNLCLLEIARGCGRHCRFCMAGYCFRKPRARSLAELEKTLLDIKKSGKKVGLMGAAISDYPEINQLCKEILGLDMNMSVASLRADSVSEPLMKALAASGLKTITLAPEAGSVKLRRIINKGIEDQHLYEAVRLALNAGIRHVRLYIMIGLPFEEEEDVTAIIKMALDLKQYMKAIGGRGMLTLSINPFVPKPFTPFQWLPMANAKTVDQRLKRIRQELKREPGIEILAESLKEAYIQGILARGDRKIGEALLAAHRLGGTKAFKTALKNCGLDASFYLYRERSIDEILPWDTLFMGFSKAYLYREYERAREQKYTAPCFTGCKRCGVCKEGENGGI